MQAVADTSVIVASAISGNPAHQDCVDALTESNAWAAGHAWIESFSVLTRLPPDIRLSANQASLVLQSAVGGVRFLGATEQTEFHLWLVTSQISGGSVYDALVGWVARSANVPLLTRDRRALPTYRALGIETLLISEAMN